RPEGRGGHAARRFPMDARGAAGGSFRSGAAHARAGIGQTSSEGMGRHATVTPCAGESLSAPCVSTIASMIHTPLSSPFVHLRVHSEFSVVDGIARIPDLVKKAVEYGQPALAITDLCNLYGFVKFYRSAQG